MAISGFKDLYVAELQEAKSFEQILTKALGKMEANAGDEQLKAAFRDHAEETREHLRTVEALIERLGEKTDAHSDQSVERLVAESEKMAGMLDAGPIRDAALIASAQRIEHYEIAVYGTLASYARHLGRDEDAEMLAAILEEEQDTDDRLSTIADGLVNPSAVEKEARA